MIDWKNLQMAHILIYISVLYLTINCFIIRSLPLILYHWPKEIFVETVNTVIKFKSYILYISIYIKNLVKNWEDLLLYKTKIVWRGSKT